MAPYYLPRIAFSNLFTRDDDDYIPLEAHWLSHGYCDDD